MWPGLATRKVPRPALAGLGFFFVGEKKKRATYYFKGSTGVAPNKKALNR